ncbi:LysR substrate-binding domain-containing protein [Jatrophihabitans sp.]|uniref:LysR substrate-binding domain-containing protein n=1 Tax=Jatrophihabitans sp. TaxID=1932789 RepID=UPI0030C756A2|nr:LysR family transcriptional regulator [Jatrophihabitans sp.]
MKLHELEVFLVVAEELHFGRAAERLHIAQPPLSRTVQQLESDLGTRLFERTTRSVRMTAAGEALLQPAREIVEGCRAARRAVQAAERGEIGRVRVGFAGPSSHLLIGHLGRAVRERHPGIELSLQSTKYAEEALRSVIGRELDLAIVRWTEEPDGISNRIVAEEHFVLVVPAKHRLARRRLVGLDECRGEPFVALPADPGSSLRDAFVRAAKEAGFLPDIVQTAPDSWTAMALVAAGVGITFSVDVAVANVVQEGIAVVPLKEGRAATYSRLAWRRGDDNPALNAVLRASEEALPTPEALRHVN